ncbi:MAG: hypothetical protein KF708_01520 [Pirellulales bacterium]|nr:hypothetical protein [Pirellulales bacterium]
MNFVGKIFVVLITVMALVFMAFAVAVYSTHKNWRDVVMNPTPTPGKPLGLKPQLDQARAANNDLQLQIEALRTAIETEQAGRRDQVAKLEQEKELLTRERDERLREQAALVEQTRRSVAAMEATQNTLEKLREEVVGLRARIVEVSQDRDKHFARMVELTDQLQQADGRLKLLEARNTELLEQKARMAQVLDRHGLDEFTPVDNIPPKIDGIVLAVGDKGLLEISLGSDDGLRTGHTLEVYRHEATNSKYLGRVEIVDLEPDRAVAKVIPQYRKGVIQKEDRVASRFD